VNPTLTLYGLALNTSRPPLAAFLPAAATDQYLPPGMPGFRDARIYPETPDLGQARA
jgi:hypothetical protein